MHRHVRYMSFLIALITASFLVAGCKDTAQQQTAPPVSVTYLTVETQRVELSTELSGRTSALEVAEVRPQVSGIIQARLFTEGQEVKEGDQLYQIDPSLYNAALAEAKAALQQAEATYNVARLTANRHIEAIKVNAVSKQEYDQAIATRDQARASVAQAKAAVDTAAINIRYTKVNAPISGHIGISSVTPGALVTANQATPLATVQHLDRMYVDVTQSSADLLRLKRSFMEGKLASAGQGRAKVQLKLEDGNLYDKSGTLALSDVTVDTGTGTVTLRAVFDNPLIEIAPGSMDRILYPGMFVRAILQEAVDEHAVLIPQIATGRDTMGRPTVFRISADDTAEVVVVEIERTLGNQYLIRSPEDGSGLNSGDRIVVDGRVKVTAGAKLAPTPYSPSSRETASSSNNAGK